MNMECDRLVERLNWDLRGVGESLFQTDSGWLNEFPLLLLNEYPIFSLQAISALDNL
jgi:hypothetical protein